MHGSCYGLFLSQSIHTMSHVANQPICVQIQLNIKTNGKRTNIRVQHVSYVYSIQNIQCQYIDAPPSELMKRRYSFHCKSPTRAGAYLRRGSNSMALFLQSLQPHLCRRSNHALVAVGLGVMTAYTIRLYLTRSASTYANHCSTLVLM
jgi:hypothetical protein